MSIKLSICIPTYNRGGYIGSTIESIVTQYNDMVEIIISDNCSTDNTEQVVQQYQQQFKRIYYSIWDKNVGADRNFLKVIELAHGEYCWFMGSDDVVQPYALAHVLMQLDKHPGITGASVNQAIYSNDMVTEIKGVPIASGQLMADRLFKDTDACFSMLGLYFGYLPGQIVKRIIWNEVASTENLEPYYNAFVHVYIVGEMLKKHPNWLYIHKKCVGYRSGNDSFLQEGGLYNRQVIAHANFEKIVNDLFGKKSFVYKKVLFMALSGYMRSDLISFKNKGISYLNQLKLLKLYTNIYWHFTYYWINIIPLFFIPNKLLKIIKICYIRINGNNNGNR